MSAIWGIAAPHIGKTTRSMFNKMTEVMPFSDKDIVNTLVTESVAIGHSTIGTIHKKGYPLKSKDGSLLALCGIPIWEGPDFLKNEIENPTDDRSNDANLVRYACRNDQLVNLGGVYAFAEWNPKANELLLGTDRLGFRGVYYTYDPDKRNIFFATRLRGLCDIAPIKDRINWDAIWEFLHFGYPLGDKTFYSNIKLLSPGNLLKYSFPRIDIKSYWDIRDIKIDSTITYQDAVKMNADALKKAIKRRVVRCSNLDTILLLSGGADSRRIAGELCSQDVNFESFTTRGFSEEDVEGSIAHDVAKALERKNTFINLPINGFIKNYWARSNRLVDYECCLHQWLLPFVENLSVNNVVNYDGIAGDILLDAVQRASGFYDKDQYFLVHNSSMKNKVGAILNDHVNISFLKKNLVRKFEECTPIDRLVESELEKYSHSENLLQLFFLLNRTRRSVSLAPSRILQQKIESVYPFLDIDLLSSGLKTPLTYRLRHTLRKDIIKFAYPKVNDIAYTEYKKNLPTHVRTYEVDYFKEKRRQLRSNIFRYFFLSDKIFNKRKVTLKMLISLFLTFSGVYKRPYEFSLTHEVFYEWLSEYDIILPK